MYPRRRTPIGRAALAALALAGLATATATALPERPPQEAETPHKHEKHLETHLARLHEAAAAFRVVGDQEAAKLLEIAIHKTELELKLAALHKHAPSAEQTSKLLRKAAELYREWGLGERAQALLDVERGYRIDALRLLPGDGKDLRRRIDALRLAPRDIEDLRTRIGILEHAHKAYAKAGDAQVAQTLARIVHMGELYLKEPDNPKIAEALQDIPEKGVWIEWLHGAAHMYRKWEAPERAQACDALAEYYARQREANRVYEGPQALDLTQLPQRLEILKTAWGALRKAEREDLADLLGRFIRLAEMQLAGADAQALSEVAQGLSQEQLIELVAHAAAHFREWGDLERAETTHALFEYYLERDAAREEQHEVLHDEVIEVLHDEKLDLERLEHRLEILRQALHAYAEARRPQETGLLERWVHLAELQLEGGPPEALAEAADGLSMMVLIKLLDGASHLFEEWDNPGAAGTVRALGDFYRARDFGDAQGAEEDHEHEQEAQFELGDLNHLETRVSILRHAHTAYAKAEKKDAAHVLERWVHVGELQLEGAEGRAMTAALEGLTKEPLIELLRGAGHLYAEWGWEQRSKACDALARYYHEQERERTGGIR